jgi:hypothetical protein
VEFFYHLFNAFTTLKPKVVESNINAETKEEDHESKQSEKKKPVKGTERSMKQTEETPIFDFAIFKLHGNLAQVDRALSYSGFQR